MVIAYTEGLRIIKIGLSKPELFVGNIVNKKTLVENGSVDDSAGNSTLKSTHSLKQEENTAKFVNANY